MTDGGRGAQAPRPHSAMDHHLPPHVSFGFLGERAVALDLIADRYYLIGAAEAAALSAMKAGAGKAAADGALDALVRRRLLGTGAGASIAPVRAAPLRSSALETAATGGHVPLLEAACLRASASLHLRVLGLKATLARWRGKRRRYASRPSQRAADDDALQVAQGFADARVLLPVKQLCVPDSLALARSLWRRGIDADVYFGVRLAPFMAHAWVQRGDMLLSDTLNTVGEYTPVFRL